MSKLTLELLEKKWKDKEAVPTIFETEGKKLKPCPFCGKDNLTIRSDDLQERLLTELSVTWVHCLTCHVEGPAGTDRRHAIGRWEARGETTWRRR